LLARAWSPPRAPGRRGRHPPIPQRPDPFAAPLPRLRLRTARGALRGRIGDGNRRPFGGNLAARARALSERCTLHQHATRAARGLCRPRGVVAANLDGEAQVL
jgi:hypothetical protein